MRDPRGAPVQTDLPLPDDALSSRKERGDAWPAFFAATRNRPRQAVLAAGARGAGRPRAQPPRHATAVPGQRTRNRPDEAPGDYRRVLGRLTATEYRALHALSLDAGGASTYEALQRRGWGPGKGDAQAVRSAVTKLRRKLGDDARNSRYILSERGLGYRMPEPDSR